MAPLTQARADHVARAWVDAWNSHDLEEILTHYDKDIVFTSPFAVQLAGKPDGTLRGIDELRDYFLTALGKYPNLKFELLHTLTSVSSIVVHYTSVNSLLAAEVMELSPNTYKVVRVIAHYTAPVGNASSK